MSNTWIGFVFGAVLAVGAVVVAAPEYRTDSAYLGQTKVCVPKNAAAVSVTIDGDSDSTGALAAGTVFHVVCTEAAWMCAGDDAVCTAVAGDFYIAADTVYYFSTSYNKALSDRFDFLDVDTDGTCYVNECM